MKRIAKSLITCLLLVAMIVATVPAGAKAAAKTKVTVPTSVVKSYIEEDTGNVSPYTVKYKLKYDKNGRVKKITAVSQITDSEWTTTFSYKKSGKNTIVTVKQDTSWGEEIDECTYKFDKKGRPISNFKSSDWEWGFADDSKETLYASAYDCYMIYFDTKGKYVGVYSLFDDKVGALTRYTYKKGVPATKTTYSFDETVPMESITKKFLKGVDPSEYLYETKTTKKSVTDAVKWMNAIILYDYLYVD